MTRLHVRMVLVIALGTATLGGLHAMGSAALTAPPTRSWAAVDAWYAETGAAAAAVVAVRLLAMLGVGWVVLAATLQLAASVSLRHGIQRTADALSPLVLRRLAHLSVTAGLVVPTVTDAPVDDPPGVAVMEVVDDTAETSTTTSTPASTTTSTVPAASAVPVPAVPADEEEVVVALGESFWSIAVDAIADARGVHPTDREVDAYWRRLVAANRARLVDPGNPDLLFPGQTLTLPAVDA